MMKYFLIFIWILSFQIKLEASGGVSNNFLNDEIMKVQVQENDSVQILEELKTEEGTLPHKTLGQINVFPKKKFKSKRTEKRYWRLIFKVKKVYPYAKEAGQLVRHYRERYPDLEKKHDNRIYIRMAEKELLRKYSKDLRKLTISEGAILIKLIDRETHKTSYELIEEFKGNVPAFFWQGVARLFGNNLKTHYDPYGEDRKIEEIIMYIEMGII